MLISMLFMMLIAILITMLFAILITILIAMLMVVVVCDVAFVESHIFAYFATVRIDKLRRRLMPWP